MSAASRVGGGSSAGSAAASAAAAAADERLLILGDPEEDPNWLEILPKKYHHFAGHYNGVSSNDPYKFRVNCSKILQSRDVLKAGGTPLDEEGGKMAGHVDLLMSPQFKL